MSFFFLSFSLSLTLQGTWVLSPQISLKSTSSPLHSACLTPPLESINSGLPSSYPVPLLIQLSHHLPNGRGWLSYHTTLPLKTSHWKILYFSYMTRPPNFYLEIWWSAHLWHCFCHLCTASPCPHMHFAGATVLKSACTLESPWGLLTKTMPKPHAQPKSVSEA